MKHVVLVCLGGAVGSGLRYCTELLFERLGARWAAVFPWATLAVNVVGCLLAGLLVGWLSREGARFGPEARALLVVGFCGGLTTFSTFALQTLHVAPVKAMVNVALSVAVGIGAAALGLWLARGA
jgi:fluoride exporter